MSERIFFVIERKPGGEFPGIYHDVLPDRLTGKDAIARVVYQMRLDKLDDCGKWLAMSLDELYRRYMLARDHNTLPHNMADPARQKGPGTVRKLGEYWSQPLPTWDQSAPFVRPPVKSRAPIAQSMCAFYEKRNGFCQLWDVSYIAGHGMPTTCRGRSSIAWQVIGKAKSDLKNIAE